jgi:hypothetical protein
MGLDMLADNYLIFAKLYNFYAFFQKANFNAERKRKIYQCRLVFIL